MSIECSVADISADGASIDVPDARHISDQFPDPAVMQWLSPCNASWPSKLNTPLWGKMNMSLRLFASIFSFVLFASSTVSYAQPAPCQRFVVEIPCSMVLKKKLSVTRECVRSSASDDFPTADDYLYNQEVYRRTAKEACERAAYFNAAGHDGGVVEVTSAGMCQFKDAMGNPEATPVYDRLVLDRMCTMKVRGPYSERLESFKNGSSVPINKKTGKPVFPAKWVKNSDLYSNKIAELESVVPEYGAEFYLGKQLEMFRVLNRWANNKKLLSDNQVRDKPRVKMNTIPEHDNQATAHHIIPRKDSFGCDCGSNSIDNAVLIPYVTNNAIGNNGSHPTLRRTIRTWRTPD